MSPRASQRWGAAQFGLTVALFGSTMCRFYPVTYRTRPPERKKKNWTKCVRKNKQKQNNSTQKHTILCGVIKNIKIRRRPLDNKALFQLLPQAGGMREGQSVTSCRMVVFLSRLWGMFDRGIAQTGGLNITSEVPLLSVCCWTASVQASCWLNRRSTNTQTSSVLSSVFFVFF